MYRHALLVLVAACVGTTACSGDDGASSGTQTDSATGTTAGSTTASTSTGTSTSSGTTGTTTTSTTAGTTGTSGTSSSTGPGTTGTTGTTGGAMPECMSNGDCTVHEDCCVCEAVPASDVPPDCEAACTETACAAIEYKAEAVCADGVCRFPETTCDPSSVVCLIPSPNCPEGTLPEVMGQCWSMKCVPVAACDWVPDCSYCDPVSEVCVVENTQLGPRYDCEPVPWECGEGPADCTCAGKLCEAPFDECSEGQGGTIQCDCPVCG